MVHNSWDQNRRRSQLLLGCWLETYMDGFSKSWLGMRRIHHFSQKQNCNPRSGIIREVQDSFFSRVNTVTVFRDTQKATVVSITEKGTTNNGANVATLHRIWKCKKRENVRCLSFSGMMMHGCMPGWRTREAICETRWCYVSPSIQPRFGPHQTSVSLLQWRMPFVDESLGFMTRLRRGWIQQTPQEFYQQGIHALPGSEKL